MLKKLTKREVTADQQEFAERTAHAGKCFLDCKAHPMCHLHPDHLVGIWFGLEVPVG